MSTVVTASGLGLLLAAGARPAHALTDQDVLKAHVPFAFHVYETTLPAGNYVIRQADMLSPGLLQIRKDDDSASAFFLVEGATPRQPLGKAELVFDRYGETRFLHAIWVPDETGAKLLPSHSELTVARKMASAPVKMSQNNTAAGGGASR
jgi:hypothetical protein